MKILSAVFARVFSQYILFFNSIINYRSFVYIKRKRKLINKTGNSETIYESSKF